MIWLGQTISLCLLGVSGRGQRAAVDMGYIVYNICLPSMIIMIFCCLDWYHVEAKEALQMTYKGVLIIFFTFHINTSDYVFLRLNDSIQCFTVVYSE